MLNGEHWNDDMQNLTAKQEFKPREFSQ